MNSFLAWWDACITACTSNACLATVLLSENEIDPYTYLHENSTLCYLEKRFCGDKKMLIQLARVKNRGDPKQVGVTALCCRQRTFANVTRMRRPSAKRDLWISFNTTFGKTEGLYSWILAHSHPRVSDSVLNFSISPWPFEKASMWVERNFEGKQWVSRFWRESS